MHQRVLYLRFFLFSTFLALTFLFVQKLFENNFVLAQSILWIGLMAGLPIGAASYARFAGRIDTWLAPCLLGAFLWSLLGSAIALKLAPLWEVPSSGFLRYMLFSFGIESLIALTLFIPVWMSCGMLELQLFSVLSQAQRRTQQLCYVCSVLGLIAGAVIHRYVLPIPSPSMVGLVSMGVFFVLCRLTPSLRSRGVAVGSFLVMVVVLLHGMYLKNPADRRWSGDIVGRVQIRHDEWNRFCRFTVLEDDRFLVGAYNATWHWLIPRPPPPASRPPRSPIRHSAADNYLVSSTGLEIRLASLIPEGATVAIIGVGGGGQLEPILARRPSDVFAIDIIPSVFPVMRSLGIEAFADPRVHPIVRDGRVFIQQSDRLFDLIYLPYAESLFKVAQNLFEPADHLYTLEAFRLYRKHLKPDGLIVITKSVVFQAYGSLVSDYHRTFQEAGFHTAYQEADGSFLLFAATNPERLTTVHRAFAGTGAPTEDAVGLARQGRVLRDDKPFLASVLFSPRILWLVSGIFLCVIIGLGVLVQRKVLRAGGLAPLLCGINYTLLLLAIQFLLFFTLPNPLEASIVGTFVFLSVIGLGALWYRQPRLLWVLTAAATLLRLVDVPPAVIAVGILSLWSGGLFPSLLHRYQRQLPTLFILDGVGAVVAGALYLWVPVVWGLRCFFVLVVSTFVVTVWVIRHTPVRQS